MKKQAGFKRYLATSLMIFSAIALSILFFFFIFKLGTIFTAFKTLIKILAPFIYGAAFAYILKPVCSLIEKLLGKLLIKYLKPDTSFKISRVFGILVSILLGFAFFYIVIALVVPQLFESVTNFVGTLPAIFDSASLWLEQLVKNNEVLVNYVKDFSTSFEETAMDYIQNSLIPGMDKVVTGFSTTVMSVVEFATNITIGIIVAIYLLWGRNTFKKQFKTVINCIFSKKWSNQIFEELKYADKTMSGFINGKILTSFIIGMICFIFLNITAMPYAMLISVFIAITNIIPFFGPLIGAIPSALLIFMIDPWKCLIFVIFIVITQQIEGNIIEPRVLGSTIGLSSFWVLFAIILFGGMFGFIGMIVGVPVFAVIYDILRKILRWGILKRKEKLLEKEEAEANALKIKNI